MAYKFTPKYVLRAGQTVTVSPGAPCPVAKGGQVSSVTLLFLQGLLQSLNSLGISFLLLTPPPGTQC